MVNFPEGFPVELVELALGPCPIGDADGIRQVGDGWTAAARSCHRTADDLARVAVQVPESAVGVTGSRIHTLSEQLAAEQRAHGEYCDSVAEQCYVGANSIELGQLTWMSMGLVLLTQLAADAWLLWGAPVAALQHRAAARTAWRTALTQLAQVLTLSGERFSASRTRLLAASTVLGAVTGAGVAWGAQMWQQYEGHRSRIDWEPVLTSAVSGATGGAAGAGVMFTRPVTGLTSRIAAADRPASRVAGTLLLGGIGGLAGGIAGTGGSVAATSALAGQWVLPTWEEIGTGLITGVVGGAVSGTAHAVRAFGPTTNAPFEAGHAAPGHSSGAESTTTLTAAAESAFRSEPHGRLDNDGVERSSGAGTGTRDSELRSLDSEDYRVRRDLAVSEACVAAGVETPEGRAAVAQSYAATYEVTAPVVVKHGIGIVDDSAADVVHHPDLKVAYLSRAGYPLAEVAAAWNPDFFETHCTVLPISRYMLAAARLDAEINGGESFPDLPDYFKYPRSVADDDLSGAMAKFTDLAVEHGLPMHTSGGKIVLVDIGVRGTIQEVLVALYPHLDFEGRYLAVMTHPDDPNPNTKTGYAMDLPVDQSNGGRPFPQLPDRVEHTFGHQDAIAVFEDTLCGTVASARSLIATETGGTPRVRADQRREPPPVDEINPLRVAPEYLDPAVRLAAAEVNLRAVQDLTQRVADQRDEGADWHGFLDRRAASGLDRIRAWVGGDSPDTALSKVLDSFVGRADGRQIAALRKTISAQEIPADQVDSIWEHFSELPTKEEQRTFIDNARSAATEAGGVSYPAPESGYRLPDRELQDRFRDTIAPELFAGVESVVSGKPEAIVAVAQTGAGKSTLIKNSVAAFEDSGVAHLTVNQLFRFHPRYDELVASGEPDPVGRIIPEAKAWFRMAIDHAIDNNYNVAVEETFKSPDRVAEAVAGFTRRGYSATVEILAVPADVSRLSMIRRFALGEDEYMPAAVHDRSYASGVELVGVLEPAFASGDVRLRIRTRAELLFDEALPSAAAAEVLQRTRGRPWGPVEQRMFLTELRRSRAEIAAAGRAGDLDPAMVDQLWREVDEVALSVEPVLSEPAAAPVRSTPDDPPGGRREPRPDTAAGYAETAESGRSRVLLLCDEWEPRHGGGVTVLNRRLAEGFAAAGHDVYVRVGHEVTGSEGGDAVAVLGPRSFDPGVDLREQMTTDMDTLPDDVDLVIAHSRHTGYAGRLIRALRYSAAALVHLVHTDSGAFGAIKGDVALGMANQGKEKALVSTADLAVGVGPVLANHVADLAASMHATPLLHELIPGVEFSPPVSPPDVDGSYNLHVFGRVDDGRKGVADAADMVRMLNERGVDVGLTVRGAPPETVSRTEKLLSQRARRSVTVLPHTSDPAETRADLHRAHLVIMPSRAESFGLVATESFAAGVPALVPDTSGAGRFLGDTTRFPAELTSGLLVPQDYTGPVSVPGWVAVIERALHGQAATWNSARQIRQLLLDDETTWQSAAEALARAAHRVRRNEVDGDR